MRKDSKIMDTVLETAKGLYDIGAIDGLTMHRFEALMVKPVKTLSSSDIKHIRLKEKMSQPVFAQLLNVSPSTVKKWENGENRPGGPALRLLTLFEDKGVNLFQ